jgi:hypothetical protein
MVGRSGSSGQRVAVETASGRIWPASAKGCAAGRLSIISCTRPAIKSVSAGALPLYGTCVISTPVIDLNNSVETCAVLPSPGVP